MFRYIERAQQYPLAKRKRIAFTGALIGTVFIAGAWFAATYGAVVLRREETARAAGARKSDPNSISPFDSLRREFDATFKEISARVGEVTDFIGKSEYER